MKKSYLQDLYDQLLSEHTVLVEDVAWLRLQLHETKEQLFAAETFLDKVPLEVINDILAAEAVDV